MRKRLVAGLIILCMCLCSCGKKEEGIEQETEEQEEVITEGIGNGGAESGATTAEAVEIVDPWESGRTDALSPDELPVLETGMLSDCITLCRIDGLKVHVMLKDDPNEEDAVTYARLLKDAKPLLDAGSGIRPGDVVNIDMYALKEEDEEFTKRGVSISVGSGTGPEELEEALIGMCKNEEKKVTVSYPEDYLYMGLNGRTVEYKVIVNSIARPDEPTEVEIGKALAYLKDETVRINRERLREAVMGAFIENSEISAYPEKVVRQARSRYERKYLAGFESLEDFLDLTGMTREEFKSTENEYVSQRAKEQLVLMALQEETGITATGEKYRQYTAVYGVNEDDPDKTLFEVITEEIRERIELLE